MRSQCGEQDGPDQRLSNKRRKIVQHAFEAVFARPLITSGDDCVKRPVGHGGFEPPANGLKNPLLYQLS